MVAPTRFVTPLVRVASAVAVTALVAAGVYAAPASSHRPRGASPLSAHVLAVVSAVWDSMDAVWSRSNEHWNELGDQNTLTQMLGTGKPTQVEYMGCLSGSIIGDTLWVREWAPAREMKQLQFAVTGRCDHMRNVVGTFHTHPYRADSAGAALKEPGLSAQDLKTFAAGRDRVIIVVWDVDSIDAAIRAADGSIVHPAPIVRR